MERRQSSEAPKLRKVPKIRSSEALQLRSSEGQWSAAPKLRRSALRCIALRYIALRCIALRYIALHCVALRCIALRLRF